MSSDRVGVRRCSWRVCVASMVIAGLLAGSAEARTGGARSHAPKAHRHTHGAHGASDGRVPTIRVLAARNASGISPWNGLSCNATSPATPDALSVAEPDIAVNPRDPANQVAAWIDLYRDNIDTAYTNDGGRHWYRSIPMGLNDCSGVSPSDPAIEGAADPSLSFSPDGTVYLSSLEDKNGFLPPTSNYSEWTDVQRSTDGGATWSAPVIVRNPPKCCIDDKDMILADQQRPGHVYVVYVNNGSGLVPPPRGAPALLFSHSTDGGQTFTTNVLPPIRGFNPQLAETRDGTLVFQVGNHAMSSTDGGSTWSAPVTVRPAITNEGLTRCGTSLAAGDAGNHDAVLNGRTVVALALDNGPDGTGPGKVDLSKSSDGGRTWSTSVVLTTPLPIWQAEIAANPRGQLGLTYYNFDPNDVTCSGTGVIPAATYVRVSNDGGNTWSRPGVIGARSWNIASGGTANFFFGYWLGEYFGMAGTPWGFAAATVQGTPISAGPGAAPITGLNSIVAGEVLSAN